VSHLIEARRSVVASREIGGVHAHLRSPSACAATSVRLATPRRARANECLDAVQQTLQTELEVILFVRWRLIETTQRGNAGERRETAVAADRLKHTNERVPA
jgi:hypothetical protein